MDVDIKFCKSAFIHGYTAVDIRLAIDNAITEYRNIHNKLLENE